eukprot:2131980-Pleurochrysis_carterae.AAC.1
MWKRGKLYDAPGFSNPGCGVHCALAKAGKIVCIGSVRKIVSKFGSNLLENLAVHSTANSVPNNAAGAGRPRTMERAVKLMSASKRSAVRLPHNLNGQALQSGARLIAMGRAIILVCRFQVWEQ